MQATLALLLLIVAAFNINHCSGHGDIVTAMDCSRGDGTYPDESFCEMFYQCVDGVALSFSCPRTTVFNPNTSLCDSQFICDFKCPLEDGIYADPKNCEKFFFCRDRTDIEMSCPDNAPVFNPELRLCDTRENHPCGHAPDHGGWSEWSHWSNCTLPCGNGTSIRVRTCTNPSPVNDGNECQGPTNETKLCNTHNCPVDGGWGPWGPYSMCSKTCGDGTHSRTRPCDSPAPAYDGKQCPGNRTEIGTCNVKACPVDGGWGNWTEWGQCSETCGNGTSTRIRRCDNPPPANGGARCNSNGIQTQISPCNLQACPDPLQDGEVCSKDKDCINKSCFCKGGCKCGPKLTKGKSCTDGQWGKTQCQSYCDCRPNSMGMQVCKCF